MLPRGQGSYPPRVFCRARVSLWQSLLPLSGFFGQIPHLWSTPCWSVPDSRRDDVLPPEVRPVRGSWPSHTRYARAVITADGLQMRCDPPCGLLRHRAAFILLCPRPSCLPSCHSEGLVSHNGVFNSRPGPSALSLALQRHPVSFWAGRRHVGQKHGRRSWEQGPCPLPHPHCPNSHLCLPDPVQGRQGHPAGGRSTRGQRQGMCPIVIGQTHSHPA